MIKQELAIEDLELEGVFLIKPKIFDDDRGVFIKIYDREILKKKGVEPLFPEDYLSESKKGVIRGLHFQESPHAQAKLVRVIRGSIYDVIVDLRKNSPTFGKWIGVTLSDENKDALYVPRGFAHGFLALAEDTLVSYKVDNDYAPGHEGGLCWDDKELAIDWPKMDSYLLSEKDKKWPAFKDGYRFD